MARPMGTIGMREAGRPAGRAERPAVRGIVVPCYHAPVRAETATSGTAVRRPGHGGTTRDASAAAARRRRAGSPDAGSGSARSSAPAQGGLGSGERTGRLNLSIMKFRQTGPNELHRARSRASRRHSGKPARSEDVMAKWIPGVATFGLICLMVLPAPGIWGVLIGGICVVAIIGSVLMWALDSVLSRGLARYARWRTRRPAAPGTPGPAWPSASRPGTSPASGPEGSRPGRIGRARPASVESTPRRCARASRCLGRSGARCSRSPPSRSPWRASRRAASSPSCRR